MAEWLVERGIGEDRALLVEADRVLAAKMHWPGELQAGQVLPARLISRSAGSARGVARGENGAEILVARLPRELSEGRLFHLVITRAAIAERGRNKRAHGRYIDESALSTRQGAPNAFLLGRSVRRFPAGLWEEVWDAAWESEIAFAGGSLLFSATPAMTLVDIDGDLAPRDLALRAIPPLALALRQFDLGGSIGIDFPTLEAKADRRAVDTSLEEALGDWPHERTAMNGFGFVQLVAQLDGPSLLHRMATSRVGAAARMVLRRAELLRGAGAILLTVHPAVQAKLEAEWIEELARRSGCVVQVAADPSIALGAGHAQMIER